MAILYDLPMEDYLLRPEVSASDLKAMQRSPAYAADREARAKKTRSTIFGSAIHTAVLEPHDLGRYVIDPESPKGGYPAGWRNTNAYKAEVAEILDAGKTPLPREEYEALPLIANRVREHEIGKQLHDLEGFREVSVFTLDDETRVACRCRPDWIVPGARMIVDVKSTRNHLGRAFARDAFAFGYHLSAAYYLDKVSEEIDVEHYVFLAVNNTRPFEIAAYTLDQDSIEQGRKEYRALLRRWADCLETDVWPSGSTTIEELRIPEYAIDYYEET